MNLEIMGLIVLILLSIGAAPKWPYSRTWGYGLSGFAALIALVMLVLLVAGKPML
jgi:asparagine N-glycosylation enzyme membrane subunit Stt3